MKAVVCFLWAAVLAQGDEYKDGQLGKHHYQELMTPFAKSANDKREYVGLVLANQMKVLLVSDPTAIQTAAVVEIPVGYRDDPEDMQGMAHFCEHMLLMGTSKYPSVKDFPSYTQSNGGDFYAYTYYEKTSYQFTVQPDALDGALDRFAQFFVAPLFNETAIEREVEAVQSELILDFENEGFRSDEVLKLLSNQSHPFAFNNNGNKETLYTGPIARGIDPRQRVVEFYDTHYSANLMSLVVVGRESLEELKEITIPKFAAVPNKELASFSVPGSPFSADQLGIQVGVDGLADNQYLDIQFLIPSNTSQYQQKHENVINEVLDAEGPGTVKAFLLKRRWVYSTEIYVQAAEEFVILGIFLKITTTGLQNKEAIVQMYIDYGRLVQKGIPENIFDEMNELEEINFQQGEAPAPLLLASDLASRMQLGLLSETMSRGRLADSDERLIREMFSHMRLDGLRLSVISKSPNNTLKHPVYDINYSVEKLNPKRFISTTEKLELPKPNPYFPRNFTLLQTDPRVVALEETPRGSLWYAGNPTNAPTAAVQVLLQRAPESPNSRAALDILASALRLKLRDKVYAAKRAGLEIKIHAASQGLSFLFEGYSDQMIKLVNETMHQIKATAISEDAFLYAKERIMSMYAYHPLDAPSDQASYSMQMALETNTWSFLSLNSSAADTTSKGFQGFVGSFLGARSIVLAMGNLARETAGRIRELTFPDKAPTEVITPAAVVMPRGDFVFRFPLASATEQNSAIVFYLELYVYPDSSMEAVSGFMSFLLKPFTYSQLRSVEQLGYSVNADSYDLGTRGGIAFYITSVYDPVHLESRIEALLVSFRNSLLDMDEEKLRALIEGYAASLKTSTLRDRTDGIWAEITNGHQRFQKDEDIRRELDSVTKDKLLAVMDARMLKGGSDRRKFSTHAVSRLAQKPKGDYTLENCGCRITNLTNWTRTICPANKE